jgi:alanine racemase
VHDRAQAEFLDRLGRMTGIVLPVHLYLDTGMSRAGLSAPQFAAICQDLGRFPAIRVRGVYTHFAAAEEDLAFTEHQMEQLDAALDAWRAALGEDLVVHAANTYAVHRDRRFHRSMVRVGLGLYGYGPQLMSGPLLSAEPAVQPIVRWVARIVHLQRYARGATVGYSRTHRLDRDSLLALVPVGYADGYPLSLGNRGVVRVAGAPGERPCSAAVVGRVNMDQIVLDLTDSPHAARLGAEVELLGRDEDSPCPLHRLAALAGSSCYELLCRLSARLPRRYLG